MDPLLLAQAQTVDRELHWFMGEIVEPAFYQLGETLQICLNLLLYNLPQHPDKNAHIERGPQIKLPVSSANLEELKGTVVRDGAYVTGMTVTLREKHFNRVLTRLQLRKPFLLPQILTAKRAIDKCMVLIAQAALVLTGTAYAESVHRDDLHPVESTESRQGERGTPEVREKTQEDRGEKIGDRGEKIGEKGEAEKADLRTDGEKSLFMSEKSEAYSVDDCQLAHHQQTHAVLVECLSELLQELETAKNSLQLPTDPALVFPSHRTPAVLFDPPLPPQLAVDFYLSQAEVCVDLKYLHRVTEKPWCDVDPATGKLHADKVRDQMRAGTPVQAAEAEAETKPGVLGAMLDHLLMKPRLEAHDYITRCVTYDGTVVMVTKKLEVLSADPVLVSAFTKLDSMEYLIRTYLLSIKELAGIDRQ